MLNDQVTRTRKSLPLGWVRVLHISSRAFQRIVHALPKALRQNNRSQCSGTLFFPGLHYIAWKSICCGFCLYNWQLCHLFCFGIPREACPGSLDTA